MQPKSNTLFHFTETAKKLKSIIANGFWPKYCLEHIGPLGFTKNEYVAYPMVCFCDIPLSRIKDHIDYYGNFGIGMTRDWAQKNGLNPILYVSNGSPLISVYKKFVLLSTGIDSENERNNAKLAVRRLLAFNKPLSGTVTLAEGPVPKDFYQESEWRYIPQSDSIKDYLTKEDFDDTDHLSQRNQETYDNAMLKFEPGDVRYIFVESDSDIPEIVDFLNSELAHFSATSLKVLMSRIVSIESLHPDL